MPATSAATASESTSVASTKTDDREVAARAHQREAVRDVPRGGGDGEAREREQPGERERVVADAQLGRRRATGTSSTAAATLAAATDGREPVDDAGASTSTVLFPQSRRSSR